MIIAHNSVGRWAKPVGKPTDLLKLELVYAFCTPTFEHNS